MCTAIVHIDPASPVPVLLVGVRDEFAERPWVRPARHWPGLIGGRDLQAGGTWLAVRPDLPRAACILNGEGRLAPEAERLSRGELPLVLAEHGKLDGIDPSRYDPFHIIGAEPAVVRLWSWDGTELTERTLAPGLHLVVNSGLEGELRGHRGATDMAARIAYFRPRLLAATRPAPVSGSTTSAWGEWLPLIDGDGLAVSEQRALVLRREFGGKIWGTGSISLVALRRDGFRYDFTATPGDPAAWYEVDQSG